MQLQGGTRAIGRIPPRMPLSGSFSANLSGGGPAQSPRSTHVSTWPRGVLHEGAAGRLRKACKEFSSVTSPRDDIVQRYGGRERALPKHAASEEGI